MTRAIGWVLGLLLVLAAPALAYDVGDAVDFSGTDEAGRARALDDYAGKTVVLVFWGSDDPASRAYAERLTALARRSGGDVVVLGVATTGGDDRASVQRAKREQGLPFPILVDPEGEIAADFGARVLTTACVIGPDGKLRYRGAIDDDPRGNRGSGVSHYLRDAVAAVKAGRSPSPATTSVRGPRIN